MIEIAELPHLNAALNTLATLFLAYGFWMIRRGERDRHRAAMLAAVVVSGLFLVSYLVYHFNSGLAKFGGVGVIRPLYFGLLISHVVLAVIITVLVPITVYRALTGDFARHRRIARWTWPMWMYVSITGVVIYVMAVHLYPYAAGPIGG